MIKLLSSILLLVPIILFAEEVVPSDQSQAPIELVFGQDGREWVKVNEEDINGQNVVEFLLKGQDKSNWTELVVLQYFQSDTLDPKELFNMFINDLSQHASPGKLTKTVLEEKDKDIFAEWKIEGSPNDQQELIRIMGNGKVVAIIRYTTRPGRVSEKNINTWKEIIKKAQLKNP